MKPQLQRSEGRNEVRNGENGEVLGGGNSVYILDLNSLYKRSSYIALSNASLDSLANALINVKVYTIKVRKAEVIPVEVKKGAPALSSMVEEVLTELSLSLSSLVGVRGATIGGQGEGVFCFDNQILNENNPEFDMRVKVPESEDELIGAKSSISWRVAADNDLAEYVMGCNVMNWGAVGFSSPPVAWGLHAPDAVTKTKVQPTPSDLRTKYFENIERMVSSQSKVVTYTATLANKGQQQETFSVFPEKTLSNGIITYDMVKAEEVPIEEDVRERSVGEKKNVLIHMVVSLSVYLNILIWVNMYMDIYIWTYM